MRVRVCFVMREGGGKSVHCFLCIISISTGLNAESQLNMISSMKQHSIEPSCWMDIGREWDKDRGKTKEGVITRRTP